MWRSSRPPRPTVSARQCGEYWSKFTAAVAAEKNRASDDVALFPAEQLRQGSVSRTDPGEFGIEGFDNVYMAV